MTYHIIGDSRAVLCRNNKAVDLTKDHKPDDPKEKARIEAAGGHFLFFFFATR